ncbi:MAG: LytTR family DNA-binding domain-containing protein [Pseudomonadota bacterium]
MTDPAALTALIVDDEELARRGLELRLQKEEDIVICGQSRNGREAVAAVKELKPDLVFLDIQMPGMDGFETLREFAGAHMPVVIFVTAFAEHAVRAFEANALDYLLKPIEDERLTRCVARARRHLRDREAVDHRAKLLKLICDITGDDLSLDQALGGLKEPVRPQRLAVKEGRTTTCIELNDIDWIEAAGDYLCIHVNSQTHVLRGTMKRMEKILDAERFARIHRSTIVNLERVQTMRSHINGEYFLRLEGDKELKVSRSYRGSVESIAVGLNEL